MWQATLLVKARRETKTTAVTGRKENAKKGKGKPGDGSLKDA
jgi:hypothetical protein